ncbi:hypothetical protein HON71_02240 [Candidatus Woesearchaeota archaeon]|jgi:hypothetical protein|nr:hypothetical protein [Candidatus Woesearchaeota archaeon]MBT5342593.1 hypothetical protein [Candidatus Woesearchaeota archaeon]
MVTIDQLEEMKRIAIIEKREKDLANEVIEDLEFWTSPYNGAVTSSTTYEQAGFGFIAAEPDSQELLDQGFNNRVDGSYFRNNRIDEDE